MLFDDVELKHTWRVPANAWYLRFYLWLWDANPQEVRFCLVFWGYMFALPALPVRLALITGKWVARFVVFVVLAVRVGFRMVRRCWRAMFPKPVKPTVTPKSLALSTLPDEPKAPRRKSLMQRGLEHIEDGASFVGIQTRTVGYASKRVAQTTVVKPVQRIGAVAITPTVSVGTAFLFVLDDVLVGIIDVFSIVVVTVVTYLARGVSAAYRYVIRPTLKPLGRTGLVALALLGKGALWTAVVGFCFVAAFGILFGLYHAATGGSALLGKINFSAVSGAVVVACVAAAHAILSVLPTVGLVLGGTLVVVAVCVGLAYLMALGVDKWLAPRIVRWVFRPAKVTVTRTGAVAKRSTVSFGQIMWIGIKSVKANTCPRIEIVEEDDD